MPPRRPPNAYIIFFSRYIKGLSEENKPTSNGMIHLTKEASSKWKTFSEVEKQVSGLPLTFPSSYQMGARDFMVCYVTQPFRDEFEAAKAAYGIQKQAYYDAVPLETMKEINRRRKVSGKPKIREFRKREDRRPVSSFFRCGLRPSPMIRNVPMQYLLDTDT